MRLIRRLLISFTLLTISIIPLHAQDSDSTRYRLRVPTVEEYLENIPLILQVWDEERPTEFDKTVEHPIVWALFDELFWRYTENEIFAQSARHLSDVLNASVIFPVLSQYMLDRPVWEEAILKAWLRENPSDLSEFEDLASPYFSGNVHNHVDFDGDDIEDYWVDFKAYTASAFLVFKRNLSVPEGYDIVAPLGWNWELTWGQKHLYSEAIVDITLDNIPEWVIRSETWWRAGWGWYYCVNKHYMTWRDGEFINVWPDSQGYCPDERLILYTKDVRIEHIDDDDDTVTEILQDEIIHDRWGCRWIRRTLFDWDGREYRQYFQQSFYEDNFKCKLLQAEVPIRAWAAEITPILAEPPLPEITPTVIPEPSLLTNAYLLQKTKEVHEAFEGRDYSEALGLIDSAIARQDRDALWLIAGALRYFRGMTLEALDRPDEALAEYVAIYEAAPESAWGRLAALHLEVVE